MEHVAKVMSQLNKLDWKYKFSFSLTIYQHGSLLLSKSPAVNSNADKLNIFLQLNKFKYQKCSSHN